MDNSDTFERLQEIHNAKGQMLQALRRLIESASTESQNPANEARQLLKEAIRKLEEEEERLFGILDTDSPNGREV